MGLSTPLEGEPEQGLWHTINLKPFFPEDASSLPFCERSIGMLGCYPFLALRGAGRRLWLRRIAKTAVADWHRGND